MSYSDTPEQSAVIAWQGVNATIFDLFAIFMPARYFRY